MDADNGFSKQADGWNMAIDGYSKLATRAIAFALIALSAAIVSPSTAAAGRAVDFPDPGGDESAPVQLGSVAPKLVGANDDFQSWVSPHEQTLGKLASAGLGAARRALSWQSLEPVAGSWDESQWREATSFYREALRLSIEPVFVLGFAPAWAWSADDLLACPSGKCIKPPARAWDAAWAQFAREAARRFPEATFEIWNEPNTAEFWGKSPDPQRFADLARLAADAIAELAPAAPLIAGGLAGVTAASASIAGDAGGMRADEFLRRAFAAPAQIATRLDGVALHFFPQSYWPFMPYTFVAGSHLAELMSGVRDAIADAGHGGMDLWFTEVGYWTADPGAPHYVVSEEQAAAYLTLLLRRLITIDDVVAVIVHRAIDGPLPPSPNRFEVRNSTFGLMRRTPALEAKPAYCALAAMNAAWKGDGSCPPAPAPKPEPAPSPAPATPAPPTPTPEPEPGEPVADAAVEKPALEVIAVRRAGRGHVRVKVAGVAATGIQLARERRRAAGKWSRWRGPRQKIRVGQATRRLHVRVRDRAGVRSRWVTRTLRARGARAT